MNVGTEWLIEARGCSESLLRDEDLLRRIFRAVIDDLGLKTLGKDIWHKFEGEGGVTGLVALTESHITCHTYPEYRIATFNLYCCKIRPEWDWKANLVELLEAEDVNVAKIDRGSIVVPASGQGSHTASGSQNVGRGSAFAGGDR